MDAANVISFGSLAVAALAIVVGPRISGKAATAQHIAQTRVEVYAEAIALMRARQFEVEDLAAGGIHPYTGPTDAEGDALTARVLLVAPEATWPAFARFFVIFQGTNLSRALMDQVHKGGGPNHAAQAQLAQAAIEMRGQLDKVIDLMAADVGTRRRPLAAPPRRLPPSLERLRQKYL